MGAANSPDVVRVPVGDTELSCVRWLGRVGAPVVFAIHGITANAWSWVNVARHLNSEIGLVAIDLRGRGGSSDAPPPYGIRAHADDVAAVINRLGGAPGVDDAPSRGPQGAVL